MENDLVDMDHKVAIERYLNMVFERVSQSDVAYPKYSEYWKISHEVDVGLIRLNQWHN